MKINFHIELEILLVTKEKNYNKGEDKKFPKMRVVGQNRVSHVVYIPLHVENEIEQRNIQKYNFVFQLGQKAFFLSVSLPRNGSTRKSVMLLQIFVKIK